MVLHTKDSKDFSLAKADFADAARKPGGAYLLFFSSGSPPWCPHCVAAEPNVKDVFSRPDGPDGFLVLTGDRPTWKDPAHPYRREFGVQGVPTAIRLGTRDTDGAVVEIGRLAAEGLKDKARLEAWVGARGPEV